MKTKLVIEINNPHEIARLLSLIEDGQRVLALQDRSQRGIDGYTSGDLERWYTSISKLTSTRCEFISDMLIN